MVRGVSPALNPLDPRMSIRKNTLWNLFGSGAPMLVGVAALPFLLREMGVERLGVLTLVWALIGYFSVFDFGLGRALTQKVSELRARGAANELLATVRQGLRLLAWLGLGGGGVLAVAVGWVDLKWLKVSESLAAETRSALLLAAFSLPATTLTSGLKGVLEGLEQFRHVNLLKFILGLANFGAPVAAVLVAGPSLNFVVLGLVIARFVIWALHQWAVVRTLPRPRGAASILTTGRLKELLVFGSWMTVSNLISPLMVVADRFFISALVGAASVAYYAVPSDMLIKALILPAAVSTAAFPTFTRLLVSDPAAAAALYRRSLGIIAAVMAPLMGLTAWLAHPGLTLWLGASFADNATTVVIILCAGILLNSLAQIPHALAQGAGRVKETSLLHLAEFVVYAPAVFFATRHFGLTGAAFAWTGRACVDAIMLHLLARQTLRARS